MGFHSINVPSEWGQLKSRNYTIYLMIVSIQLMSPASGDNQVNYLDCALRSFHSINVPSEWGHGWATIHLLDNPIPTVSIQLMSPASGDHTSLEIKFKQVIICFHSINVPSEWGPKLSLLGL